MKQHKEKNWINLSIDDLDAYIGTLLNAVALRCAKEKVEELWSTDTSIR